MQRIILILVVNIFWLNLNAQEMNSEKIDPLSIEASSEAIIMALYSETVKEIRKDSFSEKYNIPEDHISQCLPYLLSNKLIEQNEKLILTELGTMKAKDISSNGVNLIGVTAKNNSEIDIQSSKGSRAIVSGVEVTNNSKMKIDVSETVIEAKEDRSFKEYIQYYLWRKWWGKILLILIALGVVLFTVWNSLPDSSKENLLKGNTKTNKEDDKATIIQGIKVDNHSTLDIDASKNKTVK